MNILVSYNWLKEYLKTDIAPEEFASRVSLCGPSVERIHYQGDNLDKIVVGKILAVVKHPNADKLRLVEVDLGNKKLRVVCGGSNLAEGMKVAVALSGAKVKWHGEGELVELKPTEIRGIKSEGMICAAEEIGLGEQFPKKDTHDPTSHEASRGGRILDLSDLSAKPGTPLAEALNLKDAVFDIEVTTNRPDMMSVIGIAREAGTILKSPFSPPKIASVKSGQGIPLKVKNGETELCPRYQAVAIDGVKVAPSPWWLKQKLAAAGTRSINNVVDITNLVLWEMGQPLHAFDYKKLTGGEIIVRRAKKREKIKALDGNEYKLKESYLIIADGKRPVAVAGVMGGEISGVTEATKTIVLEAANFNPVSVRRTARELNLRSDSSNLFEKGLPAEATRPALLRAAALIMELAGGKIASKIFDLPVPRSLAVPCRSLARRRGEVGREKKIILKAATISVLKANKIMGVELKAKEMMDILSRLGFAVSAKGGSIKATPPYWRENDIEIEEDLIEEIARVYGYHHLPSILPTGSPPAGNGREGRTFSWEKIAKNIAIAAGYDEILSYSMIGKGMMDAASSSVIPATCPAKPWRSGKAGIQAIKIANPLTADLEYMRPCLLPGLLQTASENEKNFPQAKIFELSRVYIPAKKGELPREELHFAGINYGKSSSPNNSLIRANERMSGDGGSFYEAKGFAETILEKFGIFSSVIPVSSFVIPAIRQPAEGIQFRESDDRNLHPARSVDIYIGKDWLGSYGEIHPITLKKFGIESRAGIFYFNFDALIVHAKSRRAYSPISEFPGVKRDISFVADGRLEYEKIKEALVDADPLVADVELFDVYAGKGIEDSKKSLALHILFRSEHRTLEAAEADAAFQKIVEVLKKNFGAEIRM